MKRPNSTTVLLTAIAVLLGLNLWHSQATAQPNPQYAAAPRVVGMAPVVAHDFLMRVWSDGVVEWRGYAEQGGPDGGPYWYAGSEWVEIPEQP